MMFSQLLKYTSAIILVTIGTTPIHSQSCGSNPNNPYISNSFTWEGTGYGNEAVMDRSATTATSTINGCSEDIIVTMNLENPDNVFFSNLQNGDSSGSNGTFSSVQPGYSIWLDNNNTLFDDSGMDLDEETSLVFSFSSPIILRGVTIKDIDWRNQGVSSRWRDKVTLTAKDKFGADVPLTAVLENPSSSTININGQTALANYDSDSGDGGLDVMDTEGHVTWSSSSEIASLKVTYISGVGEAGQQIIQISNIDFCCRNTTTAENDINQTPVNVGLYGNVLTNDYDEEGDNQTVESATYFNNTGAVTTLPLGEATNIYDESNTLAGSITLNIDGTYTFIPSDNYVGSVPIEYIAWDDNSNPATDNATLDIDVIPLNDPSNNQPPVANDDTNTTEEDVTVSDNVIVPNDTDPDGDNLIVVSALVDTDGDGILNNPLSIGTPTDIYGLNTDGVTTLAGQMTMNPNGDYTFDPIPGFTGEILLEYTIEDPSTASDSAVLTIDIEIGTDNNTYANDDANAGEQDVDLTGNILTNDHDPEADDQDVLMIDTDGDGIPDTTPVDGVPETITNNGITLGTLTIDSATGIYLWNPEPTFIGTANIVYTATDGSATDDATLYLTNIPVMYKDFSDAPAKYPMVSHTGLIDVNNDETPDALNSAWLGNKSSFETAGWMSEDAEGDTGDDAIKFGNGLGDFPLSILPNSLYPIDVYLNSSKSTVVYYGMWIDYDNDGNYDDFYNGSETITGLTKSVVLVSTPHDLLNVGFSIVNIRLRADDAPLSSSDYQGNKSNGEVEDYQRTIALPVELVRFEADNNQCDVELFWETATELNNDYFIIEHSFDGVEFEPIGFVEGNGTSNVSQTYDFTHENVRQNLNYYRLKQVDYDNSFEYSETINSMSDCYDSGQGVTKIYPNPTIGKIELEFYMESARNVELIITDMVGREINRHQVELNEGNNIFEMDLSPYQAGAYYIQMKNDKGWNSQTFKVIKVED